MRQPRSGSPLWLPVLIASSGALAMQIFVTALSFVEQDLGASASARPLRGPRCARFSRREAAYSSWAWATRISVTRAACPYSPSWRAARPKRHRWS